MLPSWLGIKALSSYCSRYRVDWVRDAGWKPEMCKVILCGHALVINSKESVTKDHMISKA